MTLSTAGIVGTDNEQPIYQPEATWRWWGMQDIWLGQEGLNRYVPKIKDYVIEPETYTTYIVDDIDEVTLIPTLRQIRPANMSFVFTDDDVLFGVGSTDPKETYRMYLDTSTMPYRACIDPRSLVPGSASRYVKVFKGALTEGTAAKVISKVYDSNGSFVSENVGLELVAVDSHENHSVRIVVPFHATDALVDGEIVTVVAYAENGSVTYKRQHLVENTSFIRDTNASLKYITGISLKTPFLSPTLSDLIEYPLNIPINALNLIGRVQYSDGSALELPVDGSKFTMDGLNDYLSTIVGQQYSLSLRYALAANETAYVGVGPDSHYVTEPYRLITVDPNNSYTVKLFAYPFWVDDATGYQLRWYLLNLDRNIFFDVTDKVVYSPVTGPYDPKAYGYLQKKQVNLNLRDVSGTFKAFIHTQIADIVLNGPPTITSTPWTVAHESNPSYPMYGQDLVARRIGTNQVNLAAGITDQTEWIDRVYKATRPLLNPATELYPVTPTHFQVTYNGATTEYPMSDWNVNLNIAPAIELYRTVLIRFIRRTSDGSLNLAVAAMLIDD